jgi:hypothetical protein
MAGAGIQQTAGFRAEIHVIPPLVRMSPVNGSFLGLVKLYANTLFLPRRFPLALDKEPRRFRIFWQDLRAQKKDELI